MSLSRFAPRDTYIHKVTDPETGLEIKGMTVTLKSTNSKEWLSVTQ